MLVWIQYGVYGSVCVCVCVHTCLNAFVYVCMHVYNVCKDVLTNIGTVEEGGDGWGEGELIIWIIKIDTWVTL